MPPVGELIGWSVLGGLGAVGLTVILRNTPGITSLVREGRKPWACNICMPVYTAAAMVALPIWWTGDWRYAVSYPGAYAIGYMALDRATRPPAGPPVLPEDLLSDE